MKSFIEKIQDILYDYFDYVVMLSIVIVVIAIIGWRLDVLFAKDAADVATNPQVSTEIPNDEPGTQLPPVVDLEDDELAQEPTNNETPLTEEPIEEPINQVPTDPIPDEVPVISGEVIKISIPAGSLPGKIASILADSGLIDSSKDFIAKAVELKLDTKLKSGDFRITKGTSYEDILKVLTK